MCFWASSGDDVENVDVLGVDLPHKSGLNSVVAIPEFQVEELKGDDGTDCDLA